jgi:3-methyladenine DNA glycosylase AlkD
VATYYFIVRNEFSDTIKIAEILMHDPHDLIHKAVGWMLREMGKKEKATLVRFLQKHAHHMPRTMLRYSIERFGPTERQKYLNMI